MQRLILSLTFLVLILVSTASVAQDAQYPGGISFAERKVDCTAAGPWSVAATADAIYWTNYAAGTIMKMSMIGGYVTTLVSGQKGICSITSDGTNLYWTNYRTGTVMAMPVGGSKVLSTLASGVDKPSAIMARDKGLQWIASDGQKTIIIPKIEELKPDWGKGGAGTGPEQVTCNVCPIYCGDEPVFEKNGKITWKPKICGWESCLPCG